MKRASIKKVFSPSLLAHLFLIGLFLACIVMNFCPWNPRDRGYTSSLWKNGRFARPKGELNAIKAISAGSGHVIALKEDGSLIGWGANYSGQAVPPEGNDFIAIAAGGGHSLALKSNGSIVGWGEDYWGGLSVPPAGNDFVAITAGTHSNLALNSNGNIVEWGYGKTNFPARNGFVSVSAGNNHNLALKSDGSIVGWGEDRYGATSPAGNDFVAISAGDDYNIALKSDGSITGWGENSHGQTTPPVASDFVALSAGYRHCLALKKDGSLTAWGDNDSGQTNVPMGNDYIAVSAGGDYSLALKIDGTVDGWGANYFGQTGHYNLLKILVDKTKFDFWTSQAYGTYRSLYQIPLFPAFLVAVVVGFLSGRYFCVVLRYFYVLLIASVVYLNPDWHIWEFDDYFIKCNLIFLPACLLGLFLRHRATRKRIAWYQYIDTALIILILILGARYCTPSDL